MVDIELVIKIPDNYMDCIDKYEKGSLFDMVLTNAIKNGIPLPKGHGRLKDVDAIMSELSVVSSRPVKSQMYMIEQSPTLIEADKES